MAKYVVLNDLHPDEQPGAATIALDYAKSLSEHHETFFVYSTMQPTKGKSENLSLVGIQRYVDQNGPTYLGQLKKHLQDLFGLKKALRYSRAIHSINPEVLWIHQIGNYIPRLIIFVLKRRYRILLTLHDYSLIVPRKLYPADLSLKFLKSLNVNWNPNKRAKRNQLFQLLKRLLYSTRRSILRKYLENVELICISELQSQVHMGFGFSIQSVIPNGIRHCSCSDFPKVKDTNSVLFVGRAVGKGLERLLRSALKFQVRVTLVGEPNVALSPREQQEPSDICILGRLNRAQVFQEIHKNSFVYVASDCFDVYPTIGIESIRHGAIPITSDLTGIRDLVGAIDKSLVVSSHEELIDFDSLRNLYTIDCQRINKLLEEVNKRLLTIEESLNRYLKLI